jgi:sialic acid synthase SpsE
MRNVDFIAEVSSNHNQDIERSKKFIDKAKDSGCTGVKFQLFKIEDLFSPEVLNEREELRKRKKWELSENFIPILADYSHKKGLLFSCTPFYLDAVDALEPYVDFYKIASYELLWKELFRKCGNTGKPIVFSTGMATFEEVKKALHTLFETRCTDITILHCNSAYPTPIEDANLGSIQTLKKLVTTIEIPSDKIIKVGYSDHTVSPAVIYRAVHHYQCEFVEFHIDIDGTGEEYAAGHCWLPNEISKVIKITKSGFNADGNGEFKPSPSEISDRNWRADPADGLRPMKKIRKDSF